MNTEKQNEKMNTTMIVSVFRGFYFHIADCDTKEIIHEIKNGVVKDKVNALRQLLEDGKQEQYDKEKMDLLAFTPSATFNNRRKAGYLNVYNGNIILDIDDLLPNLLITAKEKAISCLHTLACFISPSGKGLKIIVRTSADLATHKNTFLALQKFYEELLNVFIDPSGKDASRLCFYSYDPETYYNENSTLFNL